MEHKTRTKVLSWLLSLALTLSLLPGMGQTAYAATWSGEGSQSSPYLISSLADLINLRDSVNAGTEYSGNYFKLTADIDCGTDNWAPIGMEYDNQYNEVDYYFMGTFDGNGKTITYHVANANDDRKGLFYQIPAGATVKNISVAGSISGAGSYYGGIAGENNGTIQNCSSSVSITGSGSFYGGIAGINKKGTIDHCVASGALTWNGGYNYGSYTAGIAGQNSGNGATVRDCVSLCDISAVNATQYSYAGRVIGRTVDNGTAADCYYLSTANITGDAVNAENATGKTAEELKVIGETAYNAGYTVYAKALGYTPHTHSFTYSVGTGNDANTITATCGSQDGCPLESSNYQATLTIVAPTLTTYGGTGNAAATLNGLSDFNTATGKAIATTEIKYVGRDGTTYEESATAPTGAGKYTAKITVEGQTASVDYEIEKVNQSVTAPTAKTGLVYNEKSQKLIDEPTVTNGNYEGINYQFDGGDWTANTPYATNAGTYTVNYKVLGNENFNEYTGEPVTVTIEKANQEIISPTGQENLKYTGYEQNLLNTRPVVIKGNTSSIAQFKIGDDGGWSTSLPTGTAVGEYAVFYKIEENGNYNEYNGSISVSIAKAANPATVSGTASVTKGGKTVDLAGNVTLNGATGQVTYAIDGANNGCTLDGSVLTSGENAGSVTVNVTVGEDSNYNALAATPITVTISNYTALTEANKPTITIGDDHNPPQVGDTLTASTTATDITYLWFRRQPIEGGYSYERIWDDEAGQVSHTADTYTLTAEDAGYEIFAVAYQTKGSNGETLTGDQRPEVMSDATAAVVKKQRSGLTLSPSTAQYTYAAGSVPTFTASADSFASQTAVIYYSTGRFTTGMIVPTLNDTIHPWSEVTGNTKLNAGEYYVAAYYPATDEYDAFLTPFVMLKVEKGTRSAPSKAASVDSDKLTATLAAADKGKALEFAIDGTSSWMLVTADENGMFPLGALATGAHTLYLRQQADVNYIATEASEGLAFDLTKHSVSYNANGGTGAPDTQISASAITVNTMVKPTRSGYAFAGWYEDANGTTAAKTSYTTSVTLYAKWTANSYKVKFNANGGTGTMADQSLTYDGGATALTSNSFTAPSGKHFVGWATGANGAVLYSDKQNVKNLTAEANGVVDLFAVWADNVYSVTATINSGTDGTVSVKLVRGSTELQSDSVTISSGTGTASFAGVPAGTYNIVVKQSDKTVTAAVVITSANENVTVTIPSTDTSSVLKVEEDARPVVVDGLDAEAESKAQDGSTVTVEMNVSKQEDQELSAGATEEQRETQAAIESIKEEMDKTDPLAANEEREVEYMNIDLTKTVTPSGGSGQSTPLTETTNVIAVLIPFDMTGKNIASLNLFRYHDGKATALTKHSGNGKPTSPFADAHFYVDLLNSFIYLYTNQFSTYAISYTETTSTPTPTPTPTPYYPSSGGNGGYSPTTYTPVITDTQHGKVTVSPTSPTSGAKVTITVKPDAGYEVDTLTLTDASGKSVTYTDNGNSTYTYTQPSSKVTVNVTFKPEQAAPTADVFAPFDDLDKTKWYADGIRYVLENGIMSGYGNGTFAPNDNTSRAMMAQILFNLEGGKSASDAMSYVDVNNADWFAEAIRWASAQGVMDGYGNGVFGPNDDLTREQLVTIMYRYAKNKGIDVSVGEDTNILNYNDAFDISEWAIPAMQWAVGSGLITGRTASTLNPKDKATRAEIATIIMRYCEEIAK